MVAPVAYGITGDVTDGVINAGTCHVTDDVIAGDIVMRVRC